MARRKKGLELEEDEPAIDISSLIDVTFLLLIYFIVTSTIAEQESDLMLELPSDNSSSAEPPDIDPIFFMVLKDGTIQQVLIDKSISSLSGAGKTDLTNRLPESDLADLDRTIGTYSQMAGDKAIVKVKANKEAKAQYVVDLINVLAKHNITKITFTEHAQ